MAVRATIQKSALFCTATELSVKVKSASLDIRFLITRHSPTKILQTGLLGAPAEKPHGNQAGEEVSVRSLRSGFRSK